MQQTASMSLDHANNSTNNNNTRASIAPSLYASMILSSSIKKRKVKFTIKLSIQELLSVPYLNGVLFCKVRLCDGGNHTSYSSKKEVSNSSVIWSNDSAIQFEVKTVQLYSTSQQSGELIHGIPFQPTASSNSNSNSNNTAAAYHVVGYEPCLCRISVRKELRGGKSYKKLGYVDYNLADFIFKYQQELYFSNNTGGGGGDFSVNRILKEYLKGTSGKSKKNQQRSDNSYLKINIKVIDTLLLTMSVANLPPTVTANAATADATITTPPSNKETLIEDTRPCNVTGLEDTKHFRNGSITSACSSNSSNSSSSSDDSSSKPMSTSSRSSSSITRSYSLTQPILDLVPASAATTTSLLDEDSDSLSLTIKKSNDLIPSLNLYSHNRSCSNGSIKSNVSFDFIIKNRNKKIIEDINSTCSTSSGLILHPIQPQLDHQQQQSHLYSISNCSIPPLVSSNVATVSSLSSIQVEMNKTNNNVTNHKKIEPANLRIIETRIDANEIISQIELELANLK
jgi:hypothetical protein